MITILPKTPAKNGNGNNGMPSSKEPSPSALFTARTPPASPHAVKPRSTRAKGEPTRVQKAIADIVLEHLQQMGAEGQTLRQLCSAVGETIRNRKGIKAQTVDSPYLNKNLQAYMSCENHWALNGPCPITKVQLRRDSLYFYTPNVDQEKDKSCKADSPTDPTEQPTTSRQVVPQKRVKGSRKVDADAPPASKKQLKKVRRAESSVAPMEQESPSHNLDFLDVSTEQHEMHSTSPIHEYVDSYANHCPSPVTFQSFARCERLPSPEVILSPHGLLDDPPELTIAGRSWHLHHLCPAYPPQITSAVDPPLERDEKEFHDFAAAIEQQSKPQQSGVPCVKESETNAQDKAGEAPDRTGEAEKDAENAARSTASDAKDPVTEEQGAPVEALDDLMALQSAEEDAKLLFGADPSSPILFSDEFFSGPDVTMTDGHDVTMMNSPEATMMDAENADTSTQNTDNEDIHSLMSKYLVNDVF